MTHFSVNLNKFALIRNSRKSGIPDVGDIARRCLETGVHGITVHPRPDRRHTLFEDVSALRSVVNRFPGRELNVEGYPTDEFMALVTQVRPAQVTLVPDAPDQLTSDHGWDIAGNRAFLTDTIARLKTAGIRVSLFVDPNLKQVNAARMVGCDRIELYTEAYARTYGSAANESILMLYVQAAQMALDIGIGVNAGHDLNLRNLGLFLREVPDVLEVSIGHAVIVESFDFTLEGTIRRYLEIVETVGDL